MYHSFLSIIASLQGTTLYVDLDLSCKKNKKYDVGSMNLLLDLDEGEGFILR